MRKVNSSKRQQQSRAHKPSSAVKRRVQLIGQDQERVVVSKGFCCKALLKIDLLTRLVPSPQAYY